MNIKQLLTKLKSMIYSKSEVDTRLNDYIPKAGGAVITGNSIGHINNTGNLDVCGGISYQYGGFIALRGKDTSVPNQNGFVLIGANDNSSSSELQLRPNGTLIWSGQPIQYGSDQRLKQQISEIDDKLLDAWEDVELCQFKYNDAVDQKGDTARLHTGYVVQQIDEACKSHNLDISAYGLYCHEEYPERTEEVTTENEDGTTSKETKVIEPAREHYSLRYTETLVVECAYLRREVSRLKHQNEDLEQRLKMLENK